MNIPAACIIQNLQYILTGLGDVGKVLVVGAVHILRIGLAFLVPQVIPVGGSKSDLDVLDLLGGHEAGNILELVDIGATDVLNFACADNALTGLVALLDECSYIRGIETEHIRVDVLNLFESFQAREKGTPEH